MDQPNRKRNMNILTKILTSLFNRKKPVPLSPPYPANKTVSGAIEEQKKSNFSEAYRPTPNVSPKPIKPRLVILHHTCGNYAGSVSWCLNPASRVSYHCIIAEDGRRTVLATPDKRTWHAGLANWKGKKDINSISVGLAFEKDTYSKPLTEEQMYSALEYLKPILKKDNIAFDNILDHRMISPRRKDDLNPIEYHRLKKFLLLHIP